MRPLTNPLQFDVKFIAAFITSPHEFIETNLNFEVQLIYFGEIRTLSINKRTRFPKNTLKTINT